MNTQSVNAGQVNEMGWKGQIYKFLDRPLFRAAVGAAASVRATLYTQRRCEISYSGAWIHDYGSAVFVEPKLDLRMPGEIERLAVDYAMHQYVPQPGDIVVDIGAGTGWETLFASRRVGPGGTVIAIEAHPAVFRCLDETCRRNRLDNVVRLNCAVAEFDGEVRLSDDSRHLMHSIVNVGSIPVAARRLDTICAEGAVGRIDLLKMNIEGAEALAIRGMDRMISRTRNVCISCHDFLAEESANPKMRTKAAVVEFLRGNGFEISFRDREPRPELRDCIYGRR